VTPQARREFAAGVPDFSYKPLFSLNEPDGAAGGDHTVYRKLTGDYVEKVEVNGKEYLRVEGAGMRLLAKQAMVRLVIPRDAFFLQCNCSMSVGHNKVLTSDNLIALLRFFSKCIQQPFFDFISHYTVSMVFVLTCPG